jgi:hypothetical protein
MLQVVRLEIVILTHLPALLVKKEAIFVFQMGIVAIIFALHPRKVLALQMILALVLWLQNWVHIVQKDLSVTGMFVRIVLVQIAHQILIVLEVVMASIVILPQGNVQQSNPIVKTIVNVVVEHA